MSVQVALKDALRDMVGPQARGHGYKGSAPTWRKTSEIGDVAIVNVQNWRYSSASSMRCVVNLAFCPEPWLRWHAAYFPAGLPRSIGESLGLYRTRLHPTGTPTGVDGWWRIDGTAAARDAVSDICRQLEQSGWPVLDDFFERHRLLAQVRAGDLGVSKRAHLPELFARAEALLLMDAGPSPALDELLMLAFAADTAAQRQHSERFEDFVRNEAAKAGQ